jgi:CheY-like chemotaxis protein
VNPTQKKQVPAGASRSLSILVVEDHPDTRRALEMFLQLLGHQTKLAADIKEALEMAAAGRHFDLLLSDLLLPDGNGWDLLRRLGGQVGVRNTRSPLADGVARPI